MPPSPSPSSSSSSPHAPMHRSLDGTFFPYPYPIVSIPSPSRTHPTPSYCRIKMVRVAYQGEHGAYSEAALNQLFQQSPDVIAIGHPSFSSVFSALASHSVDYALIPIENSLGGSIHDNYDLLLRHAFRVSGEIQYRVRHCLSALPGTTLDQVKIVISHPQALAQCEDYLHNLGVKIEKQYDTAGSAKMIAEQKLSNTAAVASELAAEVYGLSKLAIGIEDDPANFTRFLLLTRETDKPSPLPFALAPTISYKTSIVFALNDAPGALFKALSVFALRDIHLSKIESRPGKNIKRLLATSGTPFPETASDSASTSTSSDSSTAFTYLFFADFLAHIDDTRSENALRHLREVAVYVRVLGSYPTSASTVAGANQTVSRLEDKAKSSVGLRIGIIGFGNFGQFLARTFLKQGHTLYAQSRTDYSVMASSMGVTFTTDVNEFAKNDMDVVILAVSILSFESTVASLPWSNLSYALIVDVLSVKMHPKRVLLRDVPPETDILCVHPMFGPESGKYSWKGLPLMYDVVRINNTTRCERFLSTFRDEGCRMLEMSCEMHDAYAAGSQFITHTTGRVLAKLGCESTPINTKGFNTLLDLMANTTRDSWDLYRGLFTYNPHSRMQLDAFQLALGELKEQLLNEDEKQGNGEIERQQSLTNPRITAMKESRTVAISDRAKELIKAGHPVITLSVGEPLEPTPDFILEATMNALKKGMTKYTATAGELELRNEICAKLKRDNGLTYTPNQIVCTNGAKQAIVQVVMALAVPGDEVIIPAPYWVSYPEICVMCGVSPVIVPTTAETGYIMTGAALERAITPRTKMLILCSPNNPSGAVYSKAQLEDIARVLRAYPHIFIISDEIYEFLVFDENKHVSIASLPDMYDRTILVNGFSKAYAMTGFRLGYTAAPLWISNLALKIQGNLTSCCSSISQHAGIAALRMGMEPVYALVKKFVAKRDFIITSLRSIPGITCTMPQGAFYVLPDVSYYFGSKTKKGEVIKDSEAFCYHLLNEYHVALVPGSAFGADPCVRISYASGQNELNQAMERMTRCCRELILSK